MQDPRLNQLASKLLQHSVGLKKGEKILIEVIDSGIPLASALIKEVYRIGGMPFIILRNRQLDRQLMMEATQEQLQNLAAFEMVQMKEMDAYLGIRAMENINETADVPGEKQQLYAQYYVHPVSERRINHTKWCVLRYPCPSMAQLANMSTEAFEDYYFKVCLLDYEKMAQAMAPFKNLLEQTDLVRITGPNTDLTFSIKGLPAIPCAGKMNIPDGEIFTAPVRSSVNGFIAYNTPAVFQGVTFEHIQFQFENGKIIKASGDKTGRLNQVLDTDEGARYIGEFSFGVNPHILSPMKDTLFDEKISGSIHLTPGNAYEECNNGNKSSIHWDLVLIQTPEYGGGEIYFDGRLIRKDGRFILPELMALNPENLV
ncbi:MAG: aminopeptidase [Firmicutes bacterium]|nr:aminopeptidase [Bacillota bacterium]